jgi:hypothetical protein
LETGCRKNEVSRRIGETWLDQNVGSWAHIAVSYAKLDDEAASIKLYYNGLPILVDRVPYSYVKAPITYGEFALYLATNGEGSSDASAPKLLGYVDDLSVFSRPLADQEMLSFLEGSFTVAGPSGCRWRVGSGYRDPKLPTFATLDSSSPQSIKITVDPDLHGFGEASAHLAPLDDSRAFGRYDKVYLDALIPKYTADPEKTVFRLSISSSIGSCAWTAKAKGESDTHYEFDLSQPGFCFDPNCEFDLADVQWVAIQSNWQDDAVPSLPDSIEIQVNSVEFGVAANPLGSSTDYGGRVGVRGWCWRPTAYEAGGFARWNQLLPDAVSVNLDANKETSSRIIADFGSSKLDLSNCSTVTLDADLDEGLSGENAQFQFVVTRADGEWGVWNLGYQKPYVILLDSALIADSSRFCQGTPCPSSSRSSIVALGVQKAWNIKSQTQQTLSVTIRDVQFGPKTPEGGPCEQWSGL